MLGSRYYRLIICQNSKLLYDTFKKNYIDILKGVDKASIYELSVKDISFIYVNKAKKLDLKTINSDLVIYGAYLIPVTKKEARFDFSMVEKYGKITEF